jgi:hypothetical protein
VSPKLFEVSTDHELSPSTIGVGSGKSLSGYSEKRTVAQKKAVDTTALTCNYAVTYGIWHGMSICHG